MTLKEQIEDFSKAMEADKGDTSPTNKMRLASKIMALQAATIEGNHELTQEEWNAISPSLRGLALSGLCLLLLEACKD